MSVKLFELQARKNENGFRKLFVLFMGFSFLSVGFALWVPAVQILFQRFDFPRAESVSLQNILYYIDVRMTRGDNEKKSFFYFRKLNFVRYGAISIDGVPYAAVTEQGI